MRYLHAYIGSMFVTKECIRFHVFYLFWAALLIGLADSEYKIPQILAALFKPFNRLLKFPQAVRLCTLFLFKWPERNLTEEILQRTKIFDRHLFIVAIVVE